MSDIYKLQYNSMTLAYPGWNGYVGYELQVPQQFRLVGSTATPVTFDFSDGQSYTVTGTQDVTVNKGTQVTITAHSIRGKTFSLQGLDNFTISNVAWNHKTYTGSYVTADATLTSVNSNIIQLGLSDERDKQYSAYCVWPSSTNQAACNNYQPGVYVSAISSNCHSNGYWHDNNCTDFEQLTSASKGTCNRGGNGTKGWTTYDGGVSNVYVVEDVFGWNKIMEMSAHLNMTNITAGGSNVSYIIWGNTSAGGTTNQRRYLDGSYSRGGTMTANITKNGLTGAGCIYCIENTYNNSTRPVNHKGWYSITANMR